jgi:glucose-1-phosphatase
MAIKVLVTDLGQVLLRFDTGPPLTALREASDHPEAVGELSRFLRETGFGAGRATAADFYRLAREAMGLRLHYDDFCRVWSDMFEVDHETVALVRGAKVERRYLLSNTNEIHWAWITRNYEETLAGLDHLFVSQEMGLEKPDPRIYQEVTRVSGYAPEEHLFLDDIAENVRGAESIGWHGHVHTDAASLRRVLEQHGLL